ncbi:MAG: plastocyanin/azurin family copper-binding protein [Bacteroidota bacterium]
MRKIIPLSLLAGLAVWVPGAGAGSPTRATVVIKDFSYTPATVTIKKGGTVTWVWRGNIDHNVNGGSFRSPMLGNNKPKSWYKKFTRTGTFAYYCDPHKSFMKGKVVVRSS